VVDVTLTVAGISTTLEVTDVAGKATTSRMEIPDADIPVQVSTIPQDILEQQGVNDLVTALRNASGVEAQRFYGLYEYYTVRGFHQSDVLLVDGMRLEGNRANTQLNNVQEVQVLKGPSSILYGGGALGGVINLVRKKPQGTRAYDFSYRGGRFNTHQIAGGATGPLIGHQVLYRVDASFDHADGWRGAGADRLNVSPAVTWLISEQSRVTVHQAFNHDNFDGDGGVPISITGLKNFDPSRRFSTPYDFGRIHDSQTNVLFNQSLSPKWEIRDSLFYRRQNDQYFITEGLSYDPDLNQIDRYALYFKHHRRPLLNQTDIVGRVNFLGMKHTVLAGYEYQDFFNFTDRTADGGDFFPTSISLATLKETQTPFPASDFNVVRVDYFANRINAFYWQDQIALTKNLMLNVGGRFDDYSRSVHRDPQSNGKTTSRGPETHLEESAYTYRAGLVYALPENNQLYFSSASSFQPVTLLPANGKDLVPETGRSYEFGHRWQGFHGRVHTSLAFYKIERNNVVIAKPQGIYEQAGQQSSKGIDLDVDADLGHGVRLFANYGFTLPRFDNYLQLNEDDDGNEFLVDFKGHRPYFTQRHAANVWLTKSWRQGFSASIGARYLGSMFTNNENTILLGGWTTFSGAVSYRHSFWEASLNAENLFNRQRYFLGADYSDQVYPGAPINVFATLRMRFR
jgi:iron complex outermembrane recepter protein